MGRYPLVEPRMRCLQIFALLGALALVQGIPAVQDEQALKDVLRELTELLEARGREVTGHYQYTESNTNGGNSFGRVTNQPDEVTGHHQTGQSYTNGGNSFGRVTNQPDEVTGHHQTGRLNTNGGNSFGRVTNQPGGVTGHHQNTESNTNGGSSFGRVTNQPGGQDVVTGEQATERNTNGGNGLELATQRPGGFTGYGHQSTEGNNEMDTYTTAAPLVCKYNMKGKLKCRRKTPRKNRKNPKKSLELDEAITDSRSFQQKEQALKAVIRELADLLRVQGREVTGHHQYTESNTNGRHSFEGATNQPGGVTGLHQNTESNPNGGSLLERVTNQPGGLDVVTGHQATERNTNGGNGLELATQRPGGFTGYG